MSITDKIGKYLKESNENNMEVFEVYIKNNYYNGKYYDYGAKPYPVLAVSPEEAKKVVLRYSDDILKDLKQRKVSGKALISDDDALKITTREIGRVENSKDRFKRTSDGKTKLFSIGGAKTVTLKNGKVV